MFQVLEQGVMSQCPMYQLPMVTSASVTSFDLSQSNQMLAFGDNCGQYYCLLMFSIKQMNHLHVGSFWLELVYVTKN